MASRDYATFEMRLYANRFHFALPPLQTLISLQHDYRVIAKMGDDQMFRGIIVMRRDANIMFVDDLEGADLSFPAPTALAASMLPKHFLQSRGLNLQAHGFIMSAPRNQPSERIPRENRSRRNMASSLGVDAERPSMGLISLDLKREVASQEIMRNRPYFFSGAAGVGFSPVPARGLSDDPGAGFRAAFSSRPAGFSAMPAACLARESS